ncbi:MAG: hypothetical protein FWD19_05570, partial [Defluviitaleaceae bacterium]|nr:hypothetical protein [Defluviitaleaceae bacterium]
SEQLKIFRGLCPRTPASFFEKKEAKKLTLKKSFSIENDFFALKFLKGVWGKLFSKSFPQKKFVKKIVKKFLQKFSPKKFSCVI